MKSKGGEYKMTKKKEKSSLSNCIGTFIGLKLAEIGTLITITFGLYWFGIFSLNLFGADLSKLDIFLIWFSGLIVAFVCVLVGLIIYVIIEKNWEWAKELSGYKI